MMRIRLPFAGAFTFVVFLASYAGLTSIQVDAVINDKLLHALTFFVLTTCFYWIIDTSRRRNLNLTLLVCTAILGVGSEIVQWFLPNGRAFDLYDIVANVVGSLGAVALCSWYHMRMLERKRLTKHYQVVPEEEHDLELGEGVGAQISGATRALPTVPTSAEDWDVNAEDAWDEDEHAMGTDSGGDGPKTPSASSAGEVEPEAMKRTD